MQLFVYFEEEYMEENNESADKCHEPENHDDFAWDDVNGRRAAPHEFRQSGDQTRI